MIEKKCPSFPVSIFIAGDIETAQRTCRAFCDEVGFCVTVSPTTYVFTGGEEDGVVIGLINYPRFPKHSSEIFERALSLGDSLREEMGQDSYSIQTPEETVWRSWRPQ